MNKPNVKRGDIYYADFDPVIGSEQGGLRPVLIVQNDIGNTYSPTTIVIPLTSNPKKDLPTHLTITKSYKLSGNSLLLAEQIRTIDCSRLSEYIGHIRNDDSIWWKINRALEISLDIKKRPPQKGEIFVTSLCPKCQNHFTQRGCLLMQKGFQKISTNCGVCNNGKGLTFAILNLYRFWRNF